MLPDQGHKFVLWFWEQGQSQVITIRYSKTIIPELMMEAMKWWLQFHILRSNPNGQFMCLACARDELPLKDTI